MAKDIDSPNRSRNALIIITAAVFADMLVYGLVVPILPKYALSMGASQAAIGVLFSSYALVLLLASPFFGLLSDRIGRRIPIIIGLLGLAGATLLFSWAGNYIVLLIARSLQGLSAAMTWTAGLALLAGLYPPEERGKSMGLALSGQGMGLLLGPVLGGWLYQWGGYRLPFIVLTLIVLAVTCLAVLLVKDHAPSEESSGLGDALKVLRHGRLLLVSGLVIIGAGIICVLEPTLPIYLDQRMNLSPGLVGLIFTVQNLAYGLTTPMAGVLSTRLGYNKTIAAGLALAASSLAVIALPNSLFLIACIIALAGIGSGLILTPCLPYLAELAEQNGVKSYGLVYAVYNAAFSAGMMLGPFAGSLLADYYGFKLSFMIFGSISLTYVILMFFTRKTEVNSRNESLS